MRHLLLKKKNVLQLLILLLAFTCLLPGARAQRSEQAISLDTGSGVLQGSLILPAQPKPAPVVLLISGSGPTDRDGNSLGLPGKNHSLRMVAEQLADAGFATVRYDKRGVAASLAAGSTESALRFENYVDDAAAWLAYLKADTRFSNVVVMGHSEGASIAVLAAQKQPVQALVAIAGVAQNPADVLAVQLQASGMPADLLAQANKALSSLKEGKTVFDAPPALATLFRPSVQPYLISLYRYTPAQEIARLQLPVLIVQGDHDIQVGTEQARALKAALPAARLEIIGGMNHVLKLAPAERAANIATYMNPDLPLAPRLLPVLTDFLDPVVTPN
ncbi:alpha/beta hydrolase [Undibacterium rugosum]|uniref:alpha/beta hydrolase n=1 Tax=Undibacterium rugosum TaxID=2762291 RepID=UPI001B8388D3|nr:alpha/beta fold hydrolase [Undibacterium rugosum]MBR7779245.1 alpha/beta fold hydrolase [Undibacterium rugosum]